METVDITVSCYGYGKNLYVGLTCIDKEYGYEEPYCNVTVNLPNEYCPAYCGYLDTNNNPNLQKFVEENELGVFAGRLGASGFCTYPLYRFNPDKLRELCPNGLAEYEKENNIGKENNEKSNDDVWVDLSDIDLE